MSASHKMQDYAASDPRSVASQLRGKSDARVAVWIAYRLSVRWPARSSGEDEIGADYQAFCEAWLPVTTQPLTRGQVVAAILRKFGRRLLTQVLEH